jgi:uncharacterized protein YcbK (DUF882 family)
MTVRSTQHFNVVTDPKLTCTCCNQGQLSIAAFIILETVRMHFDKPVTVLSGPRCKAYNKKVGGAAKSEHLIIGDEDVDAVDIQVKDHTPQEVYLYLKNLPYAGMLGLGKYKSFVHVDVRGYAARW